MNQHKGFSLLEVLISLALFTITSFGLFEHRNRISQFIKQLELRIDTRQTANISKEYSFKSSNNIKSLDPADKPRDGERVEALVRTIRPGLLHE